MVAHPEEPPAPAAQGATDEVFRTRSGELLEVARPGHEAWEIISGMAISVHKDARRHYLGTEPDAADPEPFPAFEPLEGCSQDNSGGNFFIKVKISEPTQPPGKSASFDCDHRLARATHGSSLTRPCPVVDAEFVWLSIYMDANYSMDLYGMIKGPEADGPIRIFSNDF